MLHIINWYGNFANRKTGAGFSMKGDSKLAAIAID